MSPKGNCNNCSAETNLQFNGVPDDLITLQEAARGAIANLKQGFDRYTCTQNCNSNKSKCKRGGRIYNFKCHSSFPCENK